MGQHVFKIEKNKNLLMGNFAERGETMCLTAVSTGLEEK